MVMVTVITNMATVTGMVTDTDTDTDTATVSKFDVIWYEIDILKPLENQLEFIIVSFPIGIFWVGYGHGHGGHHGGGHHGHGGHHHGHHY